MDDSIKRYKQRRDARIKEKANADEEWITMKGSHILIDDGGKVKAGAGGKFNGTEYKRGNKNVKEENRPHAGKYVNMLEESGFREKKGAKAEGDMDKWEKEAFDRYEQRLADIDEKGFVRMMREAQKDRDVSQKMLDDLYNDGCERLGLSEREANKLFAKHQSALKKPPSGWRTKEEIGAKPSEGKTEAESARDRMADRVKGKAAPVPADLSAEAMREGYNKAVDEGLDADDVLAHYMRGHDIGAKVTVEGMEYEKVGDGKWKPKDKWGARWADGFEGDRDMAGRITSAYLTGGKVEVKKGSGSVESPAPRPKTKLETMKNNKERYAKVQEEIKGMKPGLERDVKEKVILPWIKGDKWMGGMPDRKFEQIAKKMPYEVNEIYNEFQKQMMKY